MKSGDPLQRPPHNTGLEPSYLLLKQEAPTLRNERTS